MPGAKDMVEAFRPYLDHALTSTQWSSASRIFLRTSSTGAWQAHGGAAHNTSRISSSQGAHCKALEIFPLPATGSRPHDSSYVSPRPPYMTISWSLNSKLDPTTPIMFLHFNSEGRQTKLRRSTLTPQALLDSFHLLRLDAPPRLLAPVLAPYAADGASLCSQDRKRHDKLSNSAEF